MSLGLFFPGTDQHNLDIRIGKYNVHSESAGLNCNNLKNFYDKLDKHNLLKDWI